MHKKAVLKKCVQVGGTTLMSRFLGIIRELLMVRYLGAGIISDAFITAYKVPNTLRKIFAEGALSAAFVPSFIAALKKDPKEAESLLSFAFILFEGALLVLCAISMLIAPHLLWVIVPGFGEEKIAITVTFFRILMPFIFFISSSAILAGALQSVGRFFVPAFGPILLNIVFIIGLCICLFFSLPVSYVCFFILLGGLLQFLQHLYAYFRAGFRFGPVNKNTWHSFSHVLAKFCMTGVSMSVMELGLFIDTSFASLLSDGSVSLIYYANRFVGIPMGVFGVAFSTILLPYFSRIGTYAPKRLNFFLYESAKLVFWVTVPCMLALIFFANAIFVTLFVPRFTMQQAHDAGTLLIVFALGLFFFSLNKVLLNLFYALHAPGLPTIVSVLVTVLNIVLNYLLMQPFAGVGLVAATTISGIMQTILLFYFLKKKFNFHGYPRHFGIFMLRYVAQLTVVSGIFYVAYRCTGAFLTLALPQSLALFFLEKIGFWLWVGPLCVMAGLLLYLYRKQCGIRLYFLD